MAELRAIFSDEFVGCLHCGSEVPSRRFSASGRHFCCGGCEVVYALLNDMGLERFYELKPKRLLPLIHYGFRDRSLEWVETLPELSSGVLMLRVEGIQCAACVWAIRELGHKMGGAQVNVEPALGELEIRFDPEVFPLKSYLMTLQRLGYRTDPISEEAGPQPPRQTDSRGLLMRMGICAAIAMNSMAISAGFYSGLSNADGSLYPFFSALNFYLASLAVIVGGSYFFSRAYQSLRHGVLHFDLPIAFGMLAAFLGSVYHYMRGQATATYFDTVSVFITLMLAGRYLQSRFIERNRHALLRESELADMKVVRLGAQVGDILFSQVREGDHVLIASGGIVPVPGVLCSTQPVECSLAWISGESMPVRYEPGASIPAGALLLGSTAIELKCQADFGRSSLGTLVPPAKETHDLPVVWQWVVKRYVVLVMTFASAGLLFWLWRDASKALSVFTAILVVTCPCSLGISIPLARALANKALLSWGVFARNGSLLDEWRSIRTVFFDKTGTLTFSTLAVRNGDVIDALSDADLAVLVSMVARSRHPASQAVYDYLKTRTLPWIATVVDERSGDGLYSQWNESRYFFGRPEVASAHGMYTVAFKKDDRVVAMIELEERLLQDAASAIADLHQQSVTVYLASGDDPTRVHAIGQQLGISAHHIYGACRPEDKAALIESHASEVLMVGDGLNDGAAFQSARLCGMPLGERSVLSDRTDFFFISGSLRFLPQIFRIAQTLERVIRMNLTFALIYNFGVVAIAMMGWMTPLLAAVVMPVSSLVIIGFTRMRMTRRRG